MNVILDTNVYVGDFTMGKPHFINVLDYVKKTGSRILMPEVVLMELESQFKKELVEKVAQARRSLGAFNAIAPKYHQELPELDVDRTTSEYISDVKAKIGFGEPSAMKAEHMLEAVKRAIGRVPPCSEQGEQIRDALIWFAVLDAAAESPEKTLVYVSNDGKAYGAASKLHLNLEADAESRGVRILYFNSLDELLKHVSTTVGRITEEWFDEHVDIDDLNMSILQQIEYDHQYDLEAIIESVERPTRIYDQPRRVRARDVDVSLDDFFVYERADSSLYVEATYLGTCSVSYLRPVRSYRDFDQGDDLDDFDTERVSVSLRTEVGFHVDQDGIQSTTLENIVLYEEGRRARDLALLLEFLSDKP